MISKPLPLETQKNDYDIMPSKHSTATQVITTSVSRSFQPHIIKVSRCHHRSFNNRHNFPLKMNTKKRRKTIHVSIRPKSNISSKDNFHPKMISTGMSLNRHHQYPSENSFIKQKPLEKSINTTNLSFQNEWNNSHANTNSKIMEKSLSRSSKVGHFEDTNTSTYSGKRIKSVRSDKIDAIDIHHRKRKKKNNTRRCLRICICITVYIVLLIIIALAIVLPILLTKKSSTKTIPVAVLRWNSSGITVAGKGITNNISNSLSNPYGFTMDSSNTLYIAEFSANRVIKWLEGASSGVIIAGNTNGALGSGASAFQYPVDVFVELNGDMYVTDRGNNRMQFWINGASSGTTVAGSSTNISLSDPSAIVRDPDSNALYITSWYGHKIVSYPSGNIVAGGNGQGYSRTQLNIPIGLVYDSFSKSFIIANFGANNILRWVLGASNWTHIAGSLSGLIGNTSTLFNQPVGVTLDPMGNIYVADASNHRIQFFLNGESEGTTIAGITGRYGLNSTLLYSPYWVKLDNQLNLYVSDTANGRIQKFLRY